MVWHTRVSRDALCGDSVTRAGVAQTKKQIIQLLGNAASSVLQPFISPICNMILSGCLWCLSKLFLLDWEFFRVRALLCIHTVSVFQWRPLAVSVLCVRINMRKVKALSSQTDEYLYTKKLQSYHSIIHLLCIQQGQKWSAVLCSSISNRLDKNIMWKKMFYTNCLWESSIRGKRTFQFGDSSLRDLFMTLDFAVIKPESCFLCFYLHAFIMHSVMLINWTTATVRTPVGRISAHLPNNNNAFFGFQKIHLPAIMPFPISWVTAYAFSAKRVGLL